MKKYVYFLMILLSCTGISYSQYTNNYSASFNGFNSYITYPHNGVLSLGTLITIEAWVNPGFLSGSTMAVVGKNYMTGFFLGIQTSGRIVFYPKGNSGFRSRVTGVVPVNKWTHIAGTYDGSTTRIYINGVLDTFTTAITGAITNNTDSLFIGADRIGASSPQLLFNGQIDNVRIWSSTRAASDLQRCMFQPLQIGFGSGSYIALIASFPHDNSTLSLSGFGFPAGTARNVSYINYSNKSVNYTDYNNNLALDGVNDYFTIANSISPGFNATTAITLEAMIKRDTLGSQPGVMNIVNKSGGTNRYNYGLYIYSTGEVVLDINSGANFLVSPQLVKNSRWNHLAGTYNSSTGRAVIYVNGDSVAGTTFAGNPVIPNDPDNLYIGGIGASSYSANKFKGQVDAVRIWRSVRTAQEIKENMFKTPVVANDLTVFDFESLTNFLHSGVTILPTTNQIVGNTFVTSSHWNDNAYLTSPMINDASGNLFNTAYYTGSSKKFFVPDNDPAGKSDSIFISSGSAVSNLKVYVLLSHTFVGDMGIVLTSPSGTSVNLITFKGSSGNDLMTLFSDAADSLPSAVNNVNGPGINAPFSPTIKPEQSLSALNGQNGGGWWKMKFTDYQAFDIGYVNGWGISIPSINNKTLILTSLIQGFYNSTTDKMVKDTARVYLRSANAPYNVIDSSKSVIDSNGVGKYIFSNISNGPVFYIVVKHRNTIETWSSGGYVFVSDTLFYNFTLAVWQSFGSNSIQVHSSPDKYAMYSGDVNQEGHVDLTDVLLVYNDAIAFSTGYRPTDVNGDNITDLSDIIITNNNSNIFVKVVKP